jgi:hypothetical protein
VSDSILDDMTPHLGATALEHDAWLALDERYLGAEDNEWWLRMAQGHRVSTTPVGSHIIRRHHEDRGPHGPLARTRGGLRLLHEHAYYFDTHPTAAAFRWKRVALQAMEAGDHRFARKALRRAARLDPEPSIAKHYLSTFSRRDGAP